MATITEDYCSFELSKLLKEKGFNCKTDMYYSPEGKLCCWMPNDLKSWLDNKGCETWWWKCVAPTIQTACKWLREVYGIFITIEIKGDPRKEDFIYYKWSVAKFNGNQITRIDNGWHTPEDYWVAECEDGEDYNKSCETAIKYCLEHLI